MKSFSLVAILGSFFFAVNSSQQITPCSTECENEKSLDCAQCMITYSDIGESQEIITVLLNIQSMQECATDIQDQLELTGTSKDANERNKRLRGQGRRIRPTYRPRGRIILTRAPRGRGRSQGRRDTANLKGVDPLKSNHVWLSEKKRNKRSPQSRRPGTGMSDTTGTSNTGTGMSDSTGTGMSGTSGTSNTGTGRSDTTGTSNTGTGRSDTTGTSSTGTGMSDTIRTSNTGTGTSDTTGTSNTGTGRSDTTGTSNTGTGRSDTTRTSSTGTGMSDTIRTSNTGTGTSDTTGTSNTGTGRSDTTGTSNTGTGRSDTTGTSNTGTGMSDTTRNTGTSGTTNTGTSTSGTGTGGLAAPVRVIPPRRRIWSLRRRPNRVRFQNRRRGKRDIVELERAKLSKESFLPIKQAEIFAVYYAVIGECKEQCSDLTSCGTDWVPCFLCIKGSF